MASIYERRILNDAEVRLAFGDPLIPIIRPDEVTLELDNSDGFFDALDLRGERITYNRFDRASSEQLSELSGTVIGQELQIDKVILRTVVQDLDDLQTMLPRRTVETGIFPLADPKQGLGKPIPIVFGLSASTHKVADAWELPYVTENTSLNQYDYLLGEGLLTNATLYRDSIGATLFTIPASEYTITSSAYSGFTAARFPVRQANFNGGMHRVFGAADGLAAERNFAIAAQSLLSNSAWGLGLSVNSASFATGAALLTTVGSLYCDGVMREPQPAIDWLNQLLIVRGMGLSKNTSGEWTISVDASTTIVQARFGHGSGQQWGNTTEFLGLQKTPVSEAVKSLVVDYRKDWFANQYILSTATRTPLAFGKDLRIQNDFIRNQTTADKAADFISKTLQFGDERLPFTAGQEARKLRPGDIIGYESTRPVFNKTMRVISISRKMDVVHLETQGWNSSIYTYTAGALPAEPSSTAASDNSKTNPTAVTSLIIVGSGTVADGQGGFAAFQTLRYNVASESFAQTYVRQQINTNSTWTTVAVNQTMGNSLSTRIDNLITGQTYAFEVDRVNILDARFHTTTVISSIRAPVDTVAPSAPTSLSIVSQHLKGITFAWVASVDLDIKNFHWEIRTAINGGGSLVQEGDTQGPGTQVTLTLSSIPYSTERSLRVRGQDWSANIGAYSTSQEFFFTQIATVDVGSSQIGTIQMIQNAVTSQIRQLVNTQTAGGTPVPGTTNPGAPGSLEVVFTVSSQTNMVTLSHLPNSGQAKTGWWAVILDNTSTSVDVMINNVSSASVVGTISIHYW